MAHEYVKKVAQEAYDQLVEKAVLDVLLPVRRMILDNVSRPTGDEKRQYGSSAGCYNCSVAGDICLGDQDPASLLCYFVEKGWKVNVTEDEYRDITLSGRLHLDEIKIGLSSVGEGKYDISYVEHISSSNTEFRIRDQGDGVELSIDAELGTGVDIVYGGHRKGVMLRLGLAVSMLTDLWGGSRLLPAED